MKYKVIWYGEMTGRNEEIVYADSPKQARKQISNSSYVEEFGDTIEIKEGHILSSDVKKLIEKYEDVIANNNHDISVLTERNDINSVKEREFMIRMYQRFIRDLKSLNKE